MILTRRRLRSQIIARVVGWSSRLRFHVEKDDHLIEVKILHRRLLHLLPAAVDQTFEGHHLRAVHIDTFRYFHEAIFAWWHRDF